MKIKLLHQVHQNIRIRNGKNDLLKMIGIVSMFIDHVGIILFPQVIILRIIGRLAFPIFAFAIANGYEHTLNLKKYFFRLLIFAVISQIPFMLTINFMELNFLFTLTVSLAVLHFFKKKQRFAAIIFIVLSVIIPMDFGLYGVLLPSFFYFFKKNLLIIAAFTLSTIFHTIIWQWAIQLFSVLGLLLILFLQDTKSKLHLPKYFFYWFYPGHLIILLIIKRMLMAC